MELNSNIATRSVTRAPRFAAEAPSLFQYLDYRRYLRDYYAYRKSQSGSFSYRLFSQKTGIDSPNYLKLIIDGQRNLTLPHARRVAKYCGMDDAQTRFFLAMVRWHHTKQPETRELLWQEVLCLRAERDASLFSTEQLSVLTDWRAIAILEMIRLKEFVPTFENAAARFRGSLSAAQWERAIQALLKVGLIRKRRERYEVINATLRTDDSIPSLCIRDYHRQLLEEAKRALETVGPAEREYQATTLAVRQSDLPRLKAEIRKLRDLALQMVENVKEADEVYQLNIQFFPLTQSQSPRGKS